MAQFTFINKENKSFSVEVVLYTMKCSHHLAYFCVVLTCSLGQMGVGHFTHKFEATEPMAWAPFMHSNMNSYCSCLNSSTPSMLLTQKWTEIWKLVFPLNFYALKTELLWFPVSLNIGSTGVFWRVSFPRFCLLLDFWVVAGGMGEATMEIIMSQRREIPWEPPTFSEQPMQTYNQCEICHDIKCAAVLCLISVLLLLVKHLN